MPRAKKIRKRERERRNLFDVQCHIKSAREEAKRRTKGRGRVSENGRMVESQLSKFFFNFFFKCKTITKIRCFNFVQKSKHMIFL